MMHCIALVFYVLLVPPILVGTVNKCKARLQNRVGSPLWQPVLDLLKLLRKDEVVSNVATWMFRFASVALPAISLFLALSVPWFADKIVLMPCDLFVLLYLLAAFRFLTLLLSLDTSSSFGTFAASREATLSILIEPAATLSLAALAVRAHTSDLNLIFGALAPQSPILWLFSGSAFLLACLVDLSRMPIDDPTTHLELTMVHEALILECSGKNLALLEYAMWLKMAVLLGLCSQCFLRAVPALSGINNVLLAFASFALLIGLAIAVGIFESLTVKLHWRKAPEFIAYALTLAFIASITALGIGSV